MIPPFHRKSAPGVRQGKVLRKNRWAETPDSDVTPQQRPFIDRQRAGRGYRHVLFKHDVRNFVALLPDWEELSQGLNGIILAPGSDSTLGWHRPGRVALCAWPRDLVLVLGPSVVAEDRPILDLLGVVPEQADSWCAAVCRFTEVSSRGYQLLAVLLHELGHHHDRMTNRSRRSARGEGFAIDYANRRAVELWPRFLQAFGC
jgi:hypothetical protein